MALTSSILLYGHDATLLETRRWVLETARFKVVTAVALPAVLTLMTQGSPELLVLCHTLTADERGAAIAAAAALRPPVKTLSFCTTRQAIGEEGIQGATVDSFAGAIGFIAAARGLLFA